MNCLLARQMSHMKCQDFSLKNKKYIYTCMSKSTMYSCGKHFLPRAVTVQHSSPESHFASKDFNQILYITKYFNMNLTSRSLIWVENFRLVSNIWASIITNYTSTQRFRRSLWPVESFNQKLYPMPTPW